MQRSKLSILALVLSGCTLIGDDEIDARVGVAADAEDSGHIDTGDTDTDPHTGDTDTDPHTGDTDTDPHTGDTAPDTGDTAPDTGDTDPHTGDTDPHTGDTAPDTGDTAVIDTDTAVIDTAPPDLDGDGFATDDCDDLDPAVNPGAPETCNGLDDNCDGALDAADPAFVPSTTDTDCDGLLDWLDLVDAPTSFVGAAVGERAMNPAAGDFNGDGTLDLAIGARFHDGAATSSGAVYLFTSPTEGAHDDATADATISGLAAGDYAGVVIDAGHDLTADGADELLIGASGAEALYLLSAPTTGDVSAAITTLTGTGVGATAAFADDLDGDGLADIAVGVAADASRGTAAGAVYLMPGTARGNIVLTDLVALYGADSNDLAGGSVDATGDLNGDGSSDLIVGAEGVDTVGTSSGEVYVVLGPVTTTMDLVDADVVLSGDTALDHAGESAGCVGDLNGDGYAEIAVVSEAGTAETTASIFYGSSAPTDAWLSAADASVSATTASTLLGSDLHGADLNGDGPDDLILGAPGLATRTDWEGGAFAFFGPLTGALTTDNADVTLLGGTTYDFTGQELSAADMDGDGRAELLLGGQLGTSSASDGYGVVYLLNLTSWR